MGYIELKVGVLDRLEMEYSEDLFSKWVESWTLGESAYDAFRSSVDIAEDAMDRMLTPEHLLLGLLNTSPILRSLVGDPQQVSSDRLLQIQGNYRPSIYEITRNDTTVKLSESLVNVLKTALDEARNHMAFYVEDYHLLAGLCKTAIAANKLLEHSGIVVGRIYDLVKTRRIAELTRFASVSPGESRYDPYRLTGKVLVKGFNYKLLRFMHIGGMGAIYAALRTSGNIDLSRVAVNDVINNSALHVYPVCLKFLKPDLVAQYPAYGKAFEQEIAIVRQLVHPNVIRIIDSGRTEEGLIYYVMEWVEGKSLEETIEESFSGLSPDE